VIEQISANKRKTVLMIAIFVLIITALVWIINQLLGMGTIGLVIALIIAGGSAFLSYWKSDAVALAVSRAKPADGPEYARLHNVIEGLCIAAGLPKPRVYVIQDEAPNAFATGRNPDHAAVAVTTGLLERMNRVELEGVLAHELSHIKNYDILVSTLAVTMVGTVAILCDLGFRSMWWGGISGRRRDNGNEAGGIILIVGIVFLILAPISAQMMQFAISRRRESLADVSGVQLTRYPPGLISALEKLRDDQTVVHSASRATAHLWIEEPIPNNQEEGRMSWLNKLFLTHPPIEQRIAALEQL
jgi:heat shock protein HtpX